MSFPTKAVISPFTKGSNCPISNLLTKREDRLQCAPIGRSGVAIIPPSHGDQRARPPIFMYAPTTSCTCTQLVSSQLLCIAHETSMPPFSTCVWSRSGEVISFPSAHQSAPLTWELPSSILETNCCCHGKCLESPFAIFRSASSRRRADLQKLVTELPFASWVWTPALYLLPR